MTLGEKVIAYALVTVPLFMVGDLLYHYRRRIKHYLRYYYPVSLLVLAKAVSMALLIIIVATALFRYAPDWMLFSWLSLLPGYQGGGIIAQPIYAAGEQTWLPWLPYIAILGVYSLFFVAMPFIVKAEEKIFRYRKTSLQTMIIYSILFGLMHTLVGVPLFFCLLLIMQGYFLACHYRKTYLKTAATLRKQSAHLRALNASTQLHLYYNMLILSLFSGLVIMAISLNAN
jgi:hypothetical protein